MTIESFIVYKVGNELGNSTSNLGDCRDQCGQFRKCQAFAFFPVDFKCFLFKLNNNIQVLNEKIDKNGLANQAYAVGFKSMVLVKKYENISLGSELYYKDENEPDDLTCIKKCLLKSNCIGVTYMLENKQCKFYQDLYYSRENTSNSISYLRSDNLGFFLKSSSSDAPQSLKGSSRQIKKDDIIEKCYDGQDTKYSERQKDKETLLNCTHQNQKFTLNIINAAKFSNTKLTSNSNSTFTLNAEQCWLLCESKKGCVASSFNDAFYDNKTFNQANNCYHFDNSYQSKDEKNWVSYVDISGFNFIISFQNIIQID